VLLAHVLGKTRSWVLAHPEVGLTPVQEGDLERAVRRLEGGVPLPYVLGKWEFFGLEFEVTPEVLIPRPETELLVERALAWLRESGVVSRESGVMGTCEVKVLDIGAGCGCIAIALAVHAPGLEVIATDISPAALAVARRNAVKHAVAERVTFLEADLFHPFQPPNSFPFITANLPYIPTAKLHRLPIYGREPTIALDGGADGLALIRRLLADAPCYLAPDGLMLLEIEASQGEEVYSLAHQAFPLAKIGLQKDLSGHDRLVEIAL